mmetsp:Transcript_31770/g.83029  ORF Transcript_31770/g.83029 Transcript_31770/m.83029 type:complete len:211 (+) Transcript_31770:1687-2319(+)
MVDHCWRHTLRVASSVVGLDTDDADTLGVHTQGGAPFFSSEVARMRQSERLSSSSKRLVSWSEELSSHSEHSRTNDGRDDAPLWASSSAQPSQLPSLQPSNRPSHRTSSISTNVRSSISSHLHTSRTSMSSQMSHRASAATSRASVALSDDGDGGGSYQRGRSLGGRTSASRQTHRRSDSSADGGRRSKPPLHEISEKGPPAASRSCEIL